MDVTSLFSSLTQVLTIGKAMVEIRDQAVLNTTIIAFQQAIMGVQEKAMELQAEQQTLLNRVHELEDELRSCRDIPGVIYEAPYYWHMTEGRKDGPFCQCCYDKNKSLIRLQSGDNGYWVCQVCKSSVTDSSYREVPITPRKNRYF